MMYVHVVKSLFNGGYVYRLRVATIINFDLKKCNTPASELSMYCLSMKKVDSSK